MRLWQEMISTGEGPYGWRFSLEDPATGQKRGFSCLEELVAYLENLTTRQCGPTHEKKSQTHEDGN